MATHKCKDKAVRNLAPGEDPLASYHFEPKMASNIHAAILVQDVWRSLKYAASP